MHGFLRKLQVPIRYRTVAPRWISLLFPNQPANSAFTAVVGRHGQEPIAKFSVQSREIAQGGLGRHFRIAAHIHPEIDFKTIADAGFRDKLPHARRLCTAVRLDVKARFHQSEINKVPRHALLGKLCIDQGIVSRLTGERTRNKATGRCRHVVDFLHDALVEADRERKTPGIHRIEEIFNDAHRRTVRRIFIVSVHAINSKAILRCRIPARFREVRVNFFQGKDNAHRHLHLVNRIFGTGKLALGRVVLFGHEQSQRFFKIMLGNGPFIIIHRLEAILVIDPWRSCRIPDDFLAWIWSGHINRNLLRLDRFSLRWRGKLRLLGSAGGQK